MAKTEKMQAPGTEQATPDTFTVSFVRDKETKNTVRYNEVGETFDHKIGALYVHKTALRNMRDSTGAWPAALKVTVQVVHA